ncbi:sensor histidine kinase [Oerskovia jenensis]|uniref:histidine kinase n=1 Tax=Oerskovia jenensis TaxID=162169 RepID=A0ABS2LFQ6_9CELL|nr:histidine kinase [Oerskovia jenensis]MBM7479260.1 signal transduction histidine kinase [Oerskovia jenensis]
MTTDRPAPEPPGSSLRTGRRTGAWGRWRALPVLVRDAVGAVVVLLAFATPLVVAPETNPSTVASVVALVVACTGLVWRRTRPLLAAGLVLTATVVSAAFDAESALALGPGLVAIYSVAAYARHVEAATATAVTVVAYPAVLVLVDGMDLTSTYVVLVVVLLLLAATLGLAISSQRAVVAAARDRAARAEESREAEAARRVTQERLRIARELHDVVAHHAAVISVQAGAAEALFDKRPDAAREAIGHVRDAGERVLTEMSTLLHLLREPDEAAAGGASPAPGIGRLPELLGEVRATGLEVVERTSGTPRRLSPVVDLTVYRVVQEALTNAHRYGSGQADLRMVHGPGSIEVEVVNPLPARDARGASGARGSGLGLVGLRERVAAAGGTAEVGSRDRTWFVRVSLPVPDDGAPRAGSAGAGRPRGGEPTDGPADPVALEAP